MGVRVFSRIVDELVTAKSVPLEAKMLYICAMTRQPPSIEALGRIAGIGSAAASRYCRQLVGESWMRLSKHGRVTRPEPILPTQVEEVLAAEAKEIIYTSPYWGEETSWAFVDWIVSPTVRLIHHARPGFLKNSDTNQNLELDIHAPEYAWGLEYYGDQHYGPTSLYPNKDEFIELNKRDLLKASLCKKSKVTLSVVNYLSLSMGGIMEAIPPRVPRRPFDPDGPYIQTLEKIGKGIASKPGWDRG